MLSFLARLGRIILKNPINSIFAVLALFLAGRAVCVQDYTLFVACLVLWAIWFMLTHMLFLFLICIIIGGGAYIYYAHGQKLRAECEQNGGEWNAKTRTCEEKKTFSDRLRQIWNDFISDSASTEKKSETPEKK